MRRWISLNLIGLFVLGLAAQAVAKPRIYKWVEDKRVSSNQVLRKPQTIRVVGLDEAQALNAVQRIMTDQLYMGLAGYKTTQQQQFAETTPDSVLPEAVIGQREVELIDENYRFVLKVKLKRYGNRTRITAEAVPVYRIRDAEAEEARDEDDTAGGNTIEVKVRAGQGSAVALGPIMIAPVLGIPDDYGIQPLPDAGRRAGEIVKSFMYFLDQQMKGQRVMQGGADQEADGVEVDVNIQTGQ